MDKAFAPRLRRLSSVQSSLVTQSCPTVCDPMDCSPSGSSVHGILQAKTLQWVAVSYSRGSSWSRDWTHSSCTSCISRWILYYCTTQETLEREENLCQDWEGWCSEFFPRGTLHLPCIMSCVLLGAPSQHSYKGLAAPGTHRPLSP